MFHLDTSKDDKAIHQRESKPIPPETARCTRLFGRSTTAREIWLQQPPLRSIVNHFLRTVTVPYHWKEEEEGKLGTDPILSASTTLEICPGVKAQGLHRDDFIWQQTHEAEQERYCLGSDVGMGLLVAGVQTTMANGATLVRLHFLILLFASDKTPIPLLWGRACTRADQTDIVRTWVAFMASFESAEERGGGAG